MSATRDYKFTDGIVFNVGSFVCSKADIIIPASAFDQLSDDEIGKRARRLVEHALVLNLEEVIEMVTSNGRLTSTPNEYLYELWEKLKSYSGDDKDIIETKNEVETEVIRRESRDKNKALSLQKRRGVQKEYAQLFVEIGKRDGFNCKHCGDSNDLTIDHIQAIINGGSNEIDNLQILCRSCNSRKGAR